MAARLDRPGDSIISGMHEQRVSSDSHQVLDLNPSLQQSSTKSGKLTDNDDDIELEELVEQSVRRFINIGTSQSTHANLAQLACNSKREYAPGSAFNNTNEEEAESEEDSDEEFYIHKALLPFRKSKSIAFGFYHSSTATDCSEFLSTQATKMSNDKPQIEMLYSNRNTKSIDDENMKELPLLSTSKLTSLNAIWPEPDADFHQSEVDFAHPTVDLLRGDILTVRDGRGTQGEREICFTDSCWSAPTYLLSASSSNSSNVSYESLENNGDLHLENVDSKLRLRGENMLHSWSAPSSFIEQTNESAEEGDNHFCIRPLRNNSAKICRSFSTNFLLTKQRHKNYKIWNRSFCALSTADEQDEFDYVPSEVESVYNHQKDVKPLMHKILLNEQDRESQRTNEDEFSEEMMSMSEESEYNDRMSVGSERDIEAKNGEEENQLYSDPDEFSTCEHLQHFDYHQIPHSQSDGHLLSTKSPSQKRPRTPYFDESLNSNFIEPNFGLPIMSIKHSATYSGQIVLPTVKMSSGRSFIERLKERQQSKKSLRKQEGFITKELPKDLVESFDIEYERMSNEDACNHVDGICIIDPNRTKSTNEEFAVDKTDYDRIPVVDHNSIYINQHRRTDDVDVIPTSIVSIQEKTDRPFTQMLEPDSTFSQIDFDNKLPNRPESLPNHWKLKNESLKSSKVYERSVMSPLWAPEEHQAKFRDQITSSSGSDKMMPGFPDFYFDGPRQLVEPDDIPMADDDSLPPTSLTEIVQQSRFKVKPALRRRSPPIASEDELTDSEISELERQIANRYSNETLNRDPDKMPSQACQSPDVQLYYCRHPNDLTSILPGSTSMPSFATINGHLKQLGAKQQVDARQHLEETANWLRKSKTTQQFDQLHSNEQKKHSTTQASSLSSSRRRILPIRPDNLNEHVSSQNIIVQPILLQQQYAQEKSYVCRRLPTVPQSPSSENSTAFSLNHMSSTLASVPTTPQPVNLNGFKLIRHNDEQILRTKMMKHTNPSPAANLPPRGTIASQLEHTHDYQLSYGIESSLVRSTTNYSLEDSYYEDGLNGNATHFNQRKTINTYGNQEDSSGISSLVSDPNNSGPTHRAQFTFVPRHEDEILLEIGDPLKIEREYEDHWCFGVNLRTGHQGLFPAAHLFPVDPIDEITSSILPFNVKTHVVEHDTFYLTLLASIEVAHHKGNDVLVQAINKVCELYQSKEEILVPQTILMEISFRGIHVIDKMKKDIFRCPTFDYFYSLQNISFCGAHPKQLRYFGFITKHPLLPRFACHVFLSNESTQPIVEAIGRAFKRSYDEYMAFAHPTEDIYIE